MKRALLRAAVLALVAGSLGVVGSSQVAGAVAAAVPETTVVKGPPKTTFARKATFRFSSEAGATFTCALDKKPAQPCTSPLKVTRKLKLGKHLFTVAATDALGNVDPTPARWKWKIITRPVLPPGCTGECRSAAPAGGYTTYVACSTRTTAKPAKECKLSQTKAAFFRSNKHDATYKVCVKFPGKKKRLCASAQPADKGETRFVTIATANLGKHKVRWYVGGKQVGSWNFEVTPG